MTNPKSENLNNIKAQNPKELNNFEFEIGACQVRDLTGLSYRDEVRWGT
jgi:hypothetical protein